VAPISFPRGRLPVTLRDAPLAKLAGAKVNVIATDAVAAGEGRYGMTSGSAGRNVFRPAQHER
jgi:hypothetical protein